MTTQNAQELPSRAYLRAAVAVVRSPNGREYAVVHFGSGTFFRTDRLGALAVRALIRGGSAAEATAAVEQVEAGAGERAWKLIVGLGERGAMTLERPATRAGTSARRLVARGLGIMLTALGPATSAAPITVLAWIYRWLPSTPIGAHVARSGGPAIAASLWSSGYSDQPASWLRDTSKQCAVEAVRNWFFMYLSTVLSRERLGRLVARLFEPRSVDALVDCLAVTKPAIQVFLHSPLCVAVPNVLRARGVDVVRIVVADAHGLNVSAHAVALRYFGDPPAEVVDATDPMASGPLLRHLREGRSVAMALDRVAGERHRTVDVEFVGHRFPRNDGPAWLAVRSGRPIVFWYTASTPTGVAITNVSVIRVDPSLPLDQRVARLSLELYARAEEAIRGHPQAWSGWGYLGRLRSSSMQDVKSAEMARPAVAGPVQSTVGAG